MLGKKKGSLRRRKRRKGKSTGLSINKTSLTIFGAVSVLLIIAVYMGQFGALSQLYDNHDALAEASANQSAHKLARFVSKYSLVLKGLASQPDLAKLMVAKNHKALARRATDLQGVFPEVLRLRLFPSGSAKLDKKQTPHLGYACLDLIGKASKSRLPPPVEVHVSGTPQQHIDIVQPVLAVQEKKIVGQMQLTLDIKLVQRWLGRLKEKGYVELSQRAGKKTLLLGYAGDGTAKSGVAHHTAKVEGTRWSISIWLPSAMSPASIGPAMILVMVAAIGLSGVVIFVLGKVLSKAVSTDLESLMRMSVQTGNGVQRHQYVLQMPEFKEAAKLLESMPRGASMERERDDDPDSLSMGASSAALNIDPLYVPSAGVTVEELDSTTMAQNTGPASNSTVPPAEIFKAYDIRGIVGQTLTPQYAQLIGQALGSEAVSRGLSKIAFARDGRLSGPELGKALVKGLQSTGMAVIDAGMVPTPVLYYAAVKLTKGSGVMLTGSHNPPNYNGFKMMLGGETLAGEAIQSLRERIEKKHFVQGEGDYETILITDKYLQRITKDVKLKRKLKVVVDCGNGVAGVVAPQLLKALGCDVVELYCDVDGNFPNHHPDPSQPENLKDVIEATRSHSADLGIAFDGDGDRLGVVSSDGKIIWPDRLMMLFAADVLSRNHGAQIIYDIKCTNNLPKVIWDKGGEPLMWKTGHSLIKAKMKQSGALLAGEMSGHIFFKERWYGFDDALYAAARLLEILAADLRQPRVVFAGLPDAINTPELRLEFPEGEHYKFMEKLQAKADFGDANVTMIDGIRADYSDGWGLVRASNTTPCLVMRFEGKDKESMARVQGKFRQALLEIEANLKLPF